MAVIRVCGQIVSFFFFLLSFVAFVAAFSGTYWMEEGSVHWGLWKVCNGDMCSNTVGSDLMTASFIGAQALMCVALGLAAVALGSYLMWLATQKPRPCVIAWTTHVSSGFCMGIGLLCWGNESVRYYGANMLAWSYWVALSACVIAILNSGVTACTTGCGADLEEETRVIAYSATKGHPGGVLFNYDNRQHNTSDQEYSDITSSEVSIPHGQHRPRPPSPRGHQQYPPPSTRQKYRY